MLDSYILHSLNNIKLFLSAEIKKYISYCTLKCLEEFTVKVTISTLRIKDLALAFLKNIDPRYISYVEINKRDKRLSLLSRFTVYLLSHVLPSLYARINLKSNPSNKHSLYTKCESPCPF